MALNHKVHGRAAPCARAFTSHRRGNASSWAATSATNWPGSGVSPGFSLARAVWCFCSALAGGAWLVTRALRPIRDISATAGKIATGDLTQRINTADTESELGQLAGVLNSTFARLDAAFAQQARFTADAAHELRTPVTVMLTHVQNGLASECPNEEHREAFEASQRAAQRMRRLIESLLELARLDAGQEPLRRDECDLALIAAAGIELIRPLAAAHSINIYADLPAAVCHGDADRLAQVVTNLLTNAIDYNHDGGEVRVTTGCDHGIATLTVGNSGPGISAEDLPHIFERFHRADKARSGTAGHSGLGLAIAQAIVQAHGGSIAAQSEPGGETIFTARLPSWNVPLRCRSQTRVPGRGVYAASTWGKKVGVEWFRHFRIGGRRSGRHFVIAEAVLPPSPSSLRPS